MKTAFFLGAGASKYFGMPTTAELFCILTKHFASDPIISAILKDGNFSNFRSLYTTITDLIDLEYSPGISLLDNIFYKGFSLSFKNLIHKLKELRNNIHGIILDRCNITDDQIKTIVSIYNLLYSFLLRTGSKNFQVFTTNYDPIVDVYAHTCNFNVVDGFETINDQLKIRWTDNFKALDADSFYLLKLHGSITWYSDNGKIFKTEGATRCAEEDVVLIPPTLSSKHYDLEPFKSLLGQFEKILEQIDVLIVIGFSFEDEKLTKIMKDAVESNNLMIVSISPDSSRDVDNAFDVTSIKLHSYMSPLQILRSSYYSIDTTFDYDSLSEIFSIFETFYPLLSTLRSTQPRNSS